MQLPLKLADAANFDEATKIAQMDYSYTDFPAPPVRVAELLNLHFKEECFVSGGIHGSKAFVQIRWPKHRKDRKPIKDALKAGIELDVQPIKTYRAAGDAICEDCGKDFRQHPVDEEQLSYTGEPFLHILCNGDRVKL